MRVVRGFEKTRLYSDELKSDREPFFLRSPTANLWEVYENEVGVKVTVGVGVKVKFGGRRGESGTAFNFAAGNEH